MLYKLHFIFRLIFITGLLLVGAAMLDAQTPGDPNDLPIALYKMGDLSFGQIIPSGIAGTVTIHPTYGRSMSGVTVVPTSFSSAALFKVTGRQNTHYVINLPASASISTTGGAAMLIDHFIAVPDSDMLGSPPNASLGAGGNDVLRIGATLHINANQASGAYYGTFYIVVSYE